MVAAVGRAKEGTFPEATRLSKARLDFLLLQNAIRQKVSWRSYNIRTRGSSRRKEWTKPGPQADSHGSGRGELGSWFQPHGLRKIISSLKREGRETASSSRIPVCPCSGVWMCLVLEMRVSVLACLFHPLSSVCFILTLWPEPINSE